nr:MAG TPA: hypothetical protein [Caudoviricetes sp.]
MINGLLFALIVAILVYILFKYFSIWLGCTASIVYILSIICIPILSFLILSVGFVGLIKVIIDVFV